MQLLDPIYWQKIKKGIIFIPEVVFEEIEKGEDDLYEWLKNSDIPIRKIINFDIIIKNLANLLHFTGKLMYLLIITKTMPFMFGVLGWDR